MARRVGALSSGKRSGRGKVKKTDHSGIIIKKNKLKRGKKSTGFTTQMVAQSDLAFDYDMRAFIELQSYDYAIHQRKMMRQGKGPSGKPLPALNETTRLYAARAGGMWKRTGESIEKMAFFPIKGSSMRATRVLKPFSQPGWMIEAITNRKGKSWDPMSTQGLAQKVIAKSIDDFRKMAVGDIASIEATFTGEGYLTSIPKPRLA